MLIFFESEVTMKKLKDLFRRKKWKMYLYASNQCVKCIKIDDEESPFENVYIIRILFKKHIIGTNFGKVIVKPVKLKYTDNEHKKIHVETKLYEGVDIE